MPCRDYYDENPSAYYAGTIEGLKKQVSFAESALCQTLTAFEKFVVGIADDEVDGLDMLGMIDFKEAGITRKQLETWWKKHKEKDAESRRKQQSREERAKEKQKKADARLAALAKLTEEERKLLGVK